MHRALHRNEMRTMEANVKRVYFQGALGVLEHLTIRLSSAAFNFSKMSSSETFLIGDDARLGGGSVAASAKITSYFKPPFASSVHRISVAVKTIVRN